MSTIRTAHLQTVARLHDPEGVLSVYVTAGSRPGPAGRPPRLPSVLRRLGAGGRHLDTLEPALTELFDAAASGRGRALFATLEGGRVQTFATQMPLGESVHFGEEAHLWPLAAAFSVEEPAGIVAVTGHGIRVVDYRLGHAVETAASPYQPAAETRELAGPGPAGGRHGPRSAAQRDLHDRRSRAHLEKFLTDAGARAADLGWQSDWQNVLVTGEPDLVAAFVAGLAHTAQPALVTAGHTVAAAVSPARVAALVAPELRAARRRRHRRLAEEVRDAYFAGEAAYGPVDTARAAQQGRVRHLLLDATRPWTRQAPAAADPGDRMVGLTYRAGGSVTLLEAEAAGPLAGGSGVAALLRS